MKSVNVPSGALRQVDVGLVWQEIYNGSGGATFNAPWQSTIRVSAGADVTVTLDGVLAMTLRSGEVEYFNTGSGNVPSQRYVVVVIGAGNARVQVAQESDVAGRLNVIAF